ncbi:hypothetical protein ACFCYI_12215 [Streptomyces sp. NPDC056257]|uniref:hypothetical protein n=1 Tax=Streptomyces sp. NPDC056257 TaxID=3345765 RepID=UPI0035E14B69
MDEEEKESAQELAEGVLLAQLQRQMTTDPRAALESVERFVLVMHEVSGCAIDVAVAAGVTWHEIGRALALLESSGLLLRQAAALLLGLPAADHAAEQEMVALACGEEHADPIGEEQGATAMSPSEEAWAAAVERFQQTTRVTVPISSMRTPPTRPSLSASQ